MKQHEIDRHKSMSSQLGMPRGTAAGRLRKLVLFDVLRRHNENICYRCGQSILFSGELSIEHKMPWEHVDANLFWDINNIAFSHLSCNIKSCRKPQKGRPSQRRITPPEGMSWCRTHKEFFPTDKFSKHNQTWNGIKRDCKDCEKIYKDTIRGNT
jgi:hypothetical protein